MDYITALRSRDRQFIHKLVFCDKDGITIQAIDAKEINGSISIQYKNGIRRTCNLILDNSTGIFTPSYDGLVSITNTLKLYTGLIVDGVEMYNQRGFFHFGNPRMTKNKSGQKTIELEMYDSFALLDNTISGILDYQYIMPAASSIYAAVVAAFVDSGLETPIIIESTAAVTTIPVSIAQGGTYADIFLTYANMLGWECFFDQYNTFRFQSPINQSVQGEIWEFSAIDSWETTYMSGIHNYEWNKVKNYILFVGDNINDVTLIASAQNNNIFSDTYIGKIGKRVSVVEDQATNTQQVAQNRVDYELQIQSNIQETADIECVPIDIINENDIVLLNDPENGFNRDRYIINTINYPLKNGGNMQCNLIKCTEAVAIGS